MPRLRSHSLQLAIYHMLKDGTMHHDLGADYFEKRDPECLMRRAVRRLRHLGYVVSQPYGNDRLGGIINEYSRAA